MVASGLIRLSSTSGKRTGTVQLTALEPDLIRPQCTSSQPGRMPATDHIDSDERALTPNIARPADGAPTQSLAETRSPPGYEEPIQQLRRQDILAASPLLEQGEPELRERQACMWE